MKRVQLLTVALLSLIFIISCNEIENELLQADIAVSENQPVQFSEAEKKFELKQWQERGFEEFKKQVIVRPTFTGDAMGTNSNK